MKKKANNLEILKNARAKRDISLDFKLELDGNTIDVTMTAPDMVWLSRVQETAKAKAKAEAVMDGLDMFPVDEEKWDNYLKLNTAKVNKREDRVRIVENLQKEKPRDLAEQIALESSWYETAKKIIPKIILVDDKKIFSTSDGLDLYMGLIKDIKIYSLLMSKFAELMSTISAVGDTEKNLTAASSPRLN